jgi:4-amino-4-deoxy-L-arabinose transferase-like glycosyltransferase
MDSTSDVQIAPPETATSSWPKRWLRRLRESPPWGAVCLAVLVSVALAVRLYRLSDVPANLTADETDFLRNAYHILAGTGPGFFGFDWTPSPAFSVYLMAGTMKVFGASIVGARLCPVLLSMGTIIAFFFLARQWLSNLASLLAGLLLATNVWFLHFSRTAWTNINADLFAVTAALLLTLAIRKRRWYFYAGAGVFAAFGLYGYSTGNMIVFLFMAYLPFALLFNRNQARQIVQGYAILLGVCFIVFLPELRHVINDWGIFTSRMRMTSIFHAKMPYIGEADMTKVLVRQAVWAARAFIFIDSSPGVMNHGLWTRYIPPQSGLLDPYVRLLFFVGLAGAAWKWRQTTLWWIMFLFPVFAVQVFSSGTPDASRGLVVAPFMFLLVGEGIERLLAAARWLGARRWFNITVPGISVGAAFALSGAVAFLAATNVNDYFDWMNTPAAVNARGPAMSHEGFWLWQQVEQEAAASGPERAGWPRWCALQIATGAIKDETVALVCRDMVPTSPSTCFKSPTATLTERDQLKRADLDRLSTAALKYKAANGQFPSTNKETLPLCPFPVVDAGCGLEPFMDLLPGESLSDTGCFPYLYASDGNTYTLYAVLEAAPEDGKTCPSVPKELAGIANVYCVRGP